MGLYEIAMATVRRLHHARVAAVPVVLLGLSAGTGHEPVIGHEWHAPVANGTRQGQAADTITAAMRARGDSIFKGKLAGGMCFTCHAQNGKGVPGLGPDLTDAKWLHGDGSMTFLVATIKAGVMKPKQSAAVMPPLGGASLTPDQVASVAAYVYSLSHKLPP